MTACKRCGLTDCGTLLNFDVTTRDATDRYIAMVACRNRQVEALTARVESAEKGAKIDADRATYYRDKWQAADRALKGIRTLSRTFVEDVEASVVFGGGNDE